MTKEEKLTIYMTQKEKDERMKYVVEKLTDMNVKRYTLKELRKEAGELWERKGFGINGLLDMIDNKRALAYQISFFEYDDDIEWFISQELNNWK